jgi:two-component system NtrC family sensor kinase
VREPAGPRPTAEAARADAVARLSWLSPGAASLRALARAPTPAAWECIRWDPGAVLLVLRQASAETALPLTASPRSLYLPALLTGPDLLDEALDLLDREPAGFVDWSDPGVRPVYDACLAYAGGARRLAAETGCCDPDVAWVCGLLAPLGWLALCAVDAAAVAACLNDAALPHDPTAAQRRHWGLDHTAVARRLCRRWRLPPWLTAIAGYLALPGAVACTLGADPVLFHLTRLAVAHTPEPGLYLGSALALYAEEDHRALGLPSSMGKGEGGRGNESQQAAHSPFPIPPSPFAWEGPRSVPLLRDLLAAAAENRRLRDSPGAARLEQEADALHRALEEQVRSEDRRLQMGRLQALAEFAAGAGHEVNNPLAVISGQAQYLLGHAADWFDPEIEAEAVGALKAIVAQTRRIHGLLRDLMLFARPSPPCRVRFDLPALLGEVAASLADLAAERRVRIEVCARPERFAVDADAGQVRQALVCLLRNAIEAAPPEGWARLEMRPGVPGEGVAVAVEDSGPGPAPSQRAALFDPFYSGRSAGRGRGLGLPIAWRLARQQGGDVCLEEPRPGQPTRFLLTLPPLEDKETRRPGDKETAGVPEGEASAGAPSPCLPISLSPCLAQAAGNGHPA